jgi:ribosomal protein S18 acetylase RimI-like enzyme
VTEIQIRPAAVADLSRLMAIDHSCQTDYVWQMDVQRDEGQVGTTFREIRLPRSVTVPYPRSVDMLTESWNRKSGMLVALADGQLIGYCRMNDLLLPATVWIMDVIVAPRYRRQGIGTMLMLAAQTWGADRKNQRSLLEVSSKSNPAIRLAQKMGYEFCGYNDQYYETQDVALFFGRQI